MKSQRRPTTHRGDSSNQSAAKKKDSEEEARRRKLHLVSLQPSMEGLQELNVEIPIGSSMIRASLNLPSDSRGVVLFLAGGNLQLQRLPDPITNQAFNQADLATLTLDPLNAEEASQQVSADDSLS